MTKEFCAKCGREIHGPMYWIKKSWYCLECYLKTPTVDDSDSDE